MIEQADITCPKCGADIPLSEAVSHRLRQSLEAEFESRRTELNAALAERERRLARKEEDAQSELHRQLEAGREKMLHDAECQAREKLSAQFKDLQQQLADKTARLQTAHATELDLRRQQRELEESKAALNLEVARKLDAERGKIAAAARQQAAEAERFKLADKDNLIDGLRKQIADLQQKAEQGSMQAQGETLELALEGELRAAFTTDLVDEVKKGERGADVKQTVRTGSGHACGAILWEAKRAKHWSAQWPAKLKADQRAGGAECAVLVTTALPAGVRGFAWRENIWICDPAFALALATALRQGLVAAATQRLQDTDRTDKMAVLYDHLCSVEFRQHVQAVVDAFIGLQRQLETEKRAFNKQWKEREKQIQCAIQHTAEIYGGIQGIAGREALPDVSSLQLAE